MTSSIVSLHLCNSLVLIFWCIFVVCVTYDEIKLAVQRGRLINVTPAKASPIGQFEDFFFYFPHLYSSSVPSKDFEGKSLCTR